MTALAAEGGILRAAADERTLSALATAQELLLPLYLALLSCFDLRKKSLPFALLAAGGAAGILLRAAEAVCGADISALCGAYLPGLLAGGLLLLSARLSREAVGYGDGLCFGTLAFWLPWGDLATLLFTALLFCALPGTAAALIKKRKHLALPFMPFVGGAYLLLRLTGLIGEALP